MRRLGVILLTGLVLGTGACATGSPGGAGASTTPSPSTTLSPTTTADDPWPGRYRYLSTRVTAGGQDRPLVGVAAIEVNLHQVGQVSVYAGCNILSMPVRLAGGRMLVGEVSSTKRACDADLEAQDTWLREFFRADPSVSKAGVEMVLRSPDAEITLLADLSPS